MQNHYSNIVESLNYLASLLEQRLNIFFQKIKAPFVYHELKLKDDASEFYKILSREDVLPEEKIIFLIAFAPHIQPNFFDSIIQQYLPNGGDIKEIGGIKGSNRSMLPTGDTIQFILAENNIEARLKVQRYLCGESVLIKRNILQLEKVKDGEPFMSGKIILNNDVLIKILTNAEPAIKFGADFPAKKISTQMAWDDAVLNAATLSQINEIDIWLNHNEKVMADEVLKRKIKPGYKVLFHGPSGTGKTLMASLLGKKHEKDVYRIDLSQIVSKYIGETEKNLEKVFTKAETKNWILFFDEADALFGKRSAVQSANDRYANQEVSYLLQRIEDYTGLLILASNFKNNIDTAFTRRFSLIVYFPLPNAQERFILWSNSLPLSIKHDNLKLEELAIKYELSGASIINIIHNATLNALASNEKIKIITGANIEECIKKELRKTDL